MAKSLGLTELIAIAIGGMVGGGIFTILGISVAMVGTLSPFAIAIGGVFALFGAYSYVKLGIYYKDEGATYAFFKRTYPKSKLAASFIGWYTIFGYISTLALYAYTFASYAISGYSNGEILRKSIAILIIAIFAFVNIWSVRGMGKIEDFMVYIKLIILLAISALFIYFGKTDLNNFISTLQQDFKSSSFLDIVTVSAITFVAYEGFQLVVNAVNEMQNPQKNIPRAIYSALIIVATIYFIIALGAVLAIPAEDLINNKEYALASGAKDILGSFGENLVIVGALLATSSAISSTLFGSSRQMARVADDGYMPTFLAKRRGTIPTNAIILMAILASLLIISGGLRVILEFGSITFLLVSLLMAIANFKIRKKTNSHPVFALIAIFGLIIGAILILWYEYKVEFKQLIFIASIYLLLTIGALISIKENHD
jgi:amino acid transporter